MNARADEIGSPAHPLRWLVVSAIGCTVIAAAAAFFRRHPVRPSVQPMSEEWIRSHGFDAGRRGEQI
jgi:hypothetical protein